MTPAHVCYVLELRVIEDSSKIPSDDMTRLALSQDSARFLSEHRETSEIPSSLSYETCKILGKILEIPALVTCAES